MSAPSDNTNPNTNTNTNTTTTNTNPNTNNNTNFNNTNNNEADKLSALQQQIKILQNQIQSIGKKEGEIEPRNPIISPVVDLIFGGISNGIGRLAVMPLANRYKVVTPTETGTSSEYYLGDPGGGIKVYTTSMADAPDIRKFLPRSAITFVAKDFFQYILPSPPVYSPPFSSSSYSPLSFLSSPIFFHQLAANTLSGSLAGALSYFLKSKSTVTPSLNKEMAIKGIYFGLYDSLKPYVIRERKNQFFASLAVALITTSITAFIFDAPSVRLYHPRIYVMRAIPGALALAIYDKLHVIAYGKSYNGVGDQ